MKIAIIGAGISGLTCARLLSGRHDVTVFEADSRIGGHTHTIPIELGGRTYAVDTGFIVFNEPNYPCFNQLLATLGVEWKSTSMSFGVRCDRSGIEWCGTSLATVFAQARNLLRPRFYRFVTEILRFNREAPALLDSGEDARVEDYAREHGYSDDFLDLYLIPLGAALWSSSSASFRSFPVRLVIEFLQNHSMLQTSGAPVWRVIEGGSSSYLEPLVQPFAGSIRTSSPIERVERREDGVAVTVARSGVEQFDEVVLACHSNEARRMLGDADELEEELLAAFPYQPNSVTLHTDTSVLPRARRAWASWNYHVPADDRSDVSVTYDMSRLQSLDAPETFCVTLGEAHDIDESRVLRRLEYDHPQFTLERGRAQARHGEVIRRRRTSFCGAYWGYGFHEDGVRSAFAVGAAYGESL